MAQLAVLGPFAEGDLGDEFRFQKSDVPFLHGFDEWGFWLDQGSKLEVQGLQGFDVKAGSNFSRKLQSVFAVHAQQERTEIHARAFGFCEASNQEFLLLMDLDFQPLSGPAAFILGLQVFRDYTFQAPLSSDAKGLEAVRRKLCGYSEDAFRPHYGFDDLSSEGQRFFPQVFAVAEEAIENRVLRSSLPLLKELKARDTLGVKYNDFSVEQEGVCVQLLDGLGYFGIAVAAVDAIPRKQGYARAFLVGKHPDPVILFLEYPVWAVERFID